MNVGKLKELLNRYPDDLRVICGYYEPEYESGVGYDLEKAIITKFKSEKPHWKVDYSPFESLCIYVRPVAEVRK